MRANDLDVASLVARHGGVWSGHPDHPVSDWQVEVGNGDTRQGYWKWVRGALELAGSDASTVKGRR